MVDVDELCECTKTHILPCEPFEEHNCDLCSVPAQRACAISMACVHFMRSYVCIDTHDLMHRRRSERRRMLRSVRSEFGHYEPTNYEKARTNPIHKSRVVPHFLAMNVNETTAALGRPGVSIVLANCVPPCSPLNGKSVRVYVFVYTGFAPPTRLLSGMLEITFIRDRFTHHRLPSSSGPDNSHCVSRICARLYSFA